MGIDSSFMISFEMVQETNNNFLNKVQAQLSAVSVENKNQPTPPLLSDTVA